MRIPASASPDVQQTIRELWQAVDALRTQAQFNPDMHGKRVTNAGDAVDPTDYVTKRQLASSTPPPPTDVTAQSGSFTEITVKGRARFLGDISIPAFTDGTAHHAITFVDSDGNLAVNGDGAQALDLNIAASLLELGYALAIRWLNQAGIGSPNVDVVNVVDHAGGSGIARFVIGLDDGSGISLTKNGTNLEIRVGGGGGLTNVTVLGLTANTIVSGGINTNGYQSNGHPGVNFGPSIVTSITIENGIVTAAS